MKVIIILLGLLGVINGQLVGGWHHCKAQPPQAALDLAKKSLQKMNMDTTNFAVDEHNIMCQLVAGMNYKFTATAGSADSASTCSFNVYVDLNNHAHLNEPATCTAKRQLGGWHHCGQPPQVAVDFAKKSLMKMNMDTTNFAINEHHVMCQVVAGMNYKFTATAGSTDSISTCSFNVYVDLHNHAHLNEPATCTAKRQLGGWHHCRDQPPQVAVDFAKKSLMKMNMDTTNFAIDEHNVMCQVVAGMNYKFTATAGSADSASTCSFNVYVDLMNHAHLNSPVTCVAKRQVGMPGGVTHINSDDKELQGAINAASKSINMMSNSMNHMTVVDVSHATKQVVRGMKYTFNIGVQVADTCRNTEEHFFATLLECPPAAGADTTTFHCVVIDVAWETPRYTARCN